jgi:threonine dehydratase
LTDAPGSLVQLLALISGLKANILNVYHDRRARNLPLYVTRVDLELETRGPDHVKKIAHKLNMAGYEMELR